MKLLIAEDDFAARKLISIYLSDLGELTIVKDGQDAVEEVKKAIEAKQPFDLLCLDIMMPNLDGVSALEKIRQIEKDNGIEGLKCCKVIMTTAKNQPKDIFGAFNSGCESYLIKPVRKKALFEEMEKLGLVLRKN